MGSFNCSAGAGHLWWGVSRAGTVLCHQLSVVRLLGKKWSHQNCPSAMPSLCSAYVKKSESSCHVVLIKWAKDCYHRVMGSCWSINIGAKLEAFMETMWKAWNLLSEQCTLVLSPYISLKCSPIMSLFLPKWGEYLANSFLCWMLVRCS